MNSQERIFEHLVDAIGYAANDYADPGSLSYKLCSPLLLQSFALPGKHVINQDGLRVFETNTSGYKAACYDMRLKVTGMSRARLRPTDTLTNLLGVYRVKSPTSIKAVAEFLRKAMDDESIDPATPLKNFIESSKT
jgi:hypothetical protein